MVPHLSLQLTHVGEVAVQRRGVAAQSLTQSSSGERLGTVLGNQRGRTIDDAFSAQRRRPTHLVLPLGSGTTVGQVASWALAPFPFCCSPSYLFT